MIAEDLLIVGILTLIVMWWFGVLWHLAKAFFRWVNCDPDE